jgi:CubicO group peptidase (beta-lactamase class C family)
MARRLHLAFAFLLSAALIGSHTSAVITASPYKQAGVQRAFAPTAADVDAFVQRAMRAFDVPGVSLAIVKDGKVVTAKGYGVRKLGDPAPVDARTLFGIASNTKAFTATALGMLVDEGKIRWDARVIDYLPWFQMSDPYVTREMTVRDLLVHRSGLGLGAGDLLWWPASTYNRREIAQRLRYIPLETSFRSAYAYDNVLYLVAGEVIETVSGQSWEDFMSSRILAKVGMSGSNVRHSDATKAGNIATPHAPVDGKVRPIAPFDSDNTNPAGGINSNAEDMAKWMLVVLGEGKLADGSQLIRPETARQITTLVTPIPIGQGPPELSGIRASFNGYGLGFGLRDYRGHKLVTHTGGLPGYVSKVALVPGAQLGVAILTNQESGSLFEAIANYVMDGYLGVQAPDWIATYQAIEQRNAAANAQSTQKSASARDTASKPSLPLDKYAGKYRDAWYGDMTIAQGGNGLTISFDRTPLLTGTLEHWQHDTFVARWKDRELRADAFVTFALNPDGTIDTVRMKAVSPETDFSYDFHDLLFRKLADTGR